MTTSRHTPAGAAAMFQIFSYFVNNVIEASLIVVPAKYIIEELGLIAVKKAQ
jgi:hypothetical protein